MRTRYAGASSGSTRAFDADVLLWRDAVVANGGSVSLERLIIVDQFVFSEKEAGTWALTDDYWGFWAENAIQALTSLKQLRLATAVNTPTFTTDRDYTFNATTQYISTGFVPSTHGVNFTASNQRIGFYERTATGSNGLDGGALTTAGSNAAYIANKNATNVMFAVLNSTANANFTLSVSSSLGLKAVSRAGGTTVLGYDRGVRLTDATGLTVSNAARPTHGIFIGGLNNAGTFSSGRACSIGFGVTGGPLSDAQEAAQSANIQAWATSVGANV